MSWRRVGRWLWRLLFFDPTYHCGECRGRCEVVYDEPCPSCDGTGLLSALPRATLKG